MDKQKTTDFDRQLEQVYQGSLLSEHEIKALCSKAQQILQNQPNVVPFSTPVVLCGDIHGQFYDLISIFQLISGKIPDQKYIFLGDYIDRGHYSVQTITLLILLKICYPDQIVLLRGNHESREVTKIYGFYDECFKKYGSSNVWRIFTDLFDYFPLTAVVQESIFCVHGGLSPSIQTLDQIQGLKRFQEVPNDGPICDLLLSIPTQQLGWGINPRSHGYTFGQDISQKFNYTNSLNIIVRSHQFLMKGYESTHDGNVMTIFSAPNYQSKFGNQGAVILIDEKLQLRVLEVNVVGKKTYD